jgi:hypothetical protein
MEIIVLKNVRQLPSARMRGYSHATPKQVEAMYFQTIGEKPDEAYQVKVGDVEYIYVPLPQEAK